MVASLFLLFILGFMILFIPPSNWSIILLFVGLLSLFCYYLLRWKIGKKLAALVSFFVFSTIIILSLGSFDIMNFVLVISLFIGIFLLIH